MDGKKRVLIAVVVMVLLFSLQYSLADNHDEVQRNQDDKWQRYTATYSRMSSYLDRTTHEFECTPLTEPQHIQECLTRAEDRTYRTYAQRNSNEHPWFRDGFVTIDDAKDFQLYCPDPGKPQWQCSDSGMNEPSYNVDAFVAWFYSEGEQTVPIPFDHDDGLYVYIFHCGEINELNCEEKEIVLSAGDSAANHPVNFHFTPGWNVVFMFNDWWDSIGDPQYLRYTAGERLSQINGVKMYSQPSADRDRDGIADESDKCPDTPPNNEVVQNQESQYYGCAEVENEAIDIGAESCRGNYVPTIQGDNKCCGDDPTEFGEIVQGEGTNEYICLTNEQEFVGRKEGSPICTVANQNWCWVEAKSDTFKIYTIKKPEQIPYDVVSNGEQWVMCNGEKAISGDIRDHQPPVISLNDNDKKRANKFYCSMEGLAFSWSECLTAREGGNSYNPSSNDGTTKVRKVGDSQFTLPFVAEDQQVIDIQQGINPREVDLATAYASIYGEGQGVNFIGFDMLEFFVQFREKPEVPFDVSLEFEGPRELDDPIYYNGNVLQYAVDPVFNLQEPYRPQWIRIQVPFMNNGYERVQSIRINGFPENNRDKIIVKNVHLAHRDPLVLNALCTGTESVTSSSWVSDIDTVIPGTPVSGEQVCIGQYGPNAWQGGQCCGDDIREYFAGGQGKGCWRSQPFSDNEEFGVIILGMKSEPRVSQQYKYVCSGTECFFSIPRATPYEIYNPHPQLYDLFFVPEQGDKVLISGSVANPNRFDQYGMIHAKRVPQQVIFTTDERGSGFFGCQQPEYVFTGVPEEVRTETVNYCSVKGDKFCSYGGGWSGEEITKTGYIPLNAEEVDGSLEEVYDSLQLNVLEGEQRIPANTRNRASQAIPGKNILPNSRFAEEFNRDIKLWKAYKGNRRLFADERSKVRAITDQILTTRIEPGLFVESEPIIIDPAKKYSLSFVGGEEPPANCGRGLIFYDAGGNRVGDNSRRYNVLFYEDVYTPLLTAKTVTVLVGAGGVACDLPEPILQVVEGERGVLVTNQNEETTLSRALSACCPSTYCWNGYVCVEPMNDKPYLAEVLPDGRTYRCLDGNWEQQEVKYDWKKQGWGFCAQESQCLVTREGEPAVTAEMFFETPSLKPSCLNTNEFMADHLCVEGNWTSRTKFVAEKLLEVVNNANTDQYTLYCSSPQEVLPELNSNILGNEQNDGAHVYNDCLQVDQPLLDVKERACINNVCVLKYIEDGEEKKIMGTTLNVPFVRTTPFLIALGADEEDARREQPCPAGGGFTNCNVAIDGGLWYSDDLKALIYSRDNVDITPNVFQQVWEELFSWVRGLFGQRSELSEETKFVQQAQNYQEIYLSVDPPKVATVVKEIIGNQTMIVAKYQNYQTPVCQFVRQERTSADIPPFAQAVRCTQQGNIQRVEVIEGIDFFWPQLTGSLRGE